MGGQVAPTEAEWEYAARGGLDGARFAWGDDEVPDGARMANTWQGEFPWHNSKTTATRGRLRSARSEPNGYGLLDMCGNVWEWTSDFFRSARRRGRSARAACRSPRVSSPQSAEPIPRRVIKGGSHLCAPNYCLRYRPAARQGETVDTSTGHIGFRCVVRDT